MLDYHLHLWPHAESSVDFRLDQIAQYCEAAAAKGVSELALTEHSHRFVELSNVVGPFWLRSGHEPTSAALAEYWAFHARNSLDDYVELALAAKGAGLPVKLGLELDYYRDQMVPVGELMAQYPFDVLIGSVHWLDAWQFDDVDVEANMDQWRTRDVDECWRDYARALEELCDARAVDVLAHPDLIKVAGYRPRDPVPYWEAMADAAARVDVSLECSSAGWKVPPNEQYPAEGFLDRLVARGLTFTTASDAHRLERVSARADELATMLESRGVNVLAAYEQRSRHLVALRD